MLSGQIAFRMKLHAMCLVLPVSQPHDFTRQAQRFRIDPGSHFQFRRQGLFGHNQAVITSRLERIWQPSKQPTTVVVNH